MYAEEKPIGETAGEALAKKVLKLCHRRDSNFAQLKNSLLTSPV